MIKFDRKVYFDSVRASLFGGSMTKGQVAGQEGILDAWELKPLSEDLRHLAYCFATTKWETANEMQPIEEYGKGKGQPYGKPDPETGNTFFGRGYLQITWKSNYERATNELGLTGDNDLVWHPDRALHHPIAAAILFLGTTDGWFRKSKDGKPQTLARYFDSDTDDPYNAREIINGDKTKVPPWTNGVSIGNMIAGYHRHFLTALTLAAMEVVEPEEPTDVALPVMIDIKVPEGVEIVVSVNGRTMS